MTRWRPVRDVRRELGVRLLIRKDLAEISQPDAEAGLVVETIPQGHPFLPRDLVETAPVGLVLKAARRSRTSRKNLIVARANVGHLLFRDQPVAEGSAPVRATLEDREFAYLVRDLPDDLYASRTGANDRDFLPGQLNRLVRPVERVEGAAFKGVHAFVARHCRYR